MCTYYTELVPLSGSSGKGPDGWFPVLAASVYYDHPVHVPAEHTVNVDFINLELGPAAVRRRPGMIAELKVRVWGTRLPLIFISGVFA